MRGNEKSIVITIGKYFAAEELSDQGKGRDGCFGRQKGDETMREVDGGVFLNEPNVGRITEALRRIFNDGVAKECGATLTGVRVVRKDTGEVVYTSKAENQVSA